MVRSFPLYVHLGQGASISINLDASPWGLGAYLEINRHIVSFFTCVITVEEAALLGHEIGSSAAQQTFEALAALVALRAWKDHWIEQRGTICVRSDSISSLVLVLKLKTSGPGPGIIAREIALDVADALYRPDVVEHVPGVANLICDMLSRQFQPNPKSKYVLPLQLVHVKELVLPVRSKQYYRTLS